VTAEYSAEDYHCEQLRLLVWSGFFNERDFQDYLDDLEHDGEALPHISMLTETGRAELAEKRSAEAAWPTETDCDRLDAAFARLEKRGILALANAGYTTSDAHGDAWAVISETPGYYRGFCYYHGQDVERAVQGQSLWLGFDAVAQDAEAKGALGEEIAEELRLAGFDVAWDGNPETRMSIDGLEWKRRTRWKMAAESPSDEGGTKRGWLGRLLGG
jgi:hypothetical protein